MEKREDIICLLERIDNINCHKNGREHPSWIATHKHIWAGCYDVWFCEQDRIDAQTIPKLRMQEIKDLGLVESRIEDKGKYKVELWNLTEKGKEYLNGKS